MQRVFVCLGCGVEASRTHQATLRLCWDCNDQHRKEASRAVAIVGQAVGRGTLLPATAYSCADCQAPAIHYDHRDYTQPLSVDPVCAPCNSKRGRAFNSFLRPVAQPA